MPHHALHGREESISRERKRREIDIHFNGIQEDHLRYAREININTCE